MKVLLLFCLLLETFLSSAPQQSKDQLVGTWELQDINGTPPDIPPTLTFNSDLTMKMSYMDEDRRGTYTLKGDSLTLEMGEVIQYHKVFALVRDSLVLTHGEGYKALEMTFRKLP